MRPVNAEMDSTRVLNKVSGIANTRAKTIPAVAIAIVRQASIATNFRKSGLALGGTKSAKNLRVTFRFSASKKTQGLNSVEMSAGTNRTIARIARLRRECHAGSFIYEGAEAEIIENIKAAFD
jgi:hypothetical protein